MATMCYYAIEPINSISNEVWPKKAIRLARRFGGEATPCPQLWDRTNSSLEDAALIWDASIAVYCIMLDLEHRISTLIFTSQDIDHVYLGTDIEIRLQLKECIGVPEHRLTLVRQQDHFEDSRVGVQGMDEKSFRFDYEMRLTARER